MEIYNYQPVTRQRPIRAIVHVAQLRSWSAKSPRAPNYFGIYRVLAVFGSLY